MMVTSGYAVSTVVVVWMGVPREPMNRVSVETSRKHNSLSIPVCRWGGSLMSGHRPFISELAPISQPHGTEECTILVISIVINYTVLYANYEQSALIYDKRKYSTIYSSYTYREAQEGMHMRWMFWNWGIHLHLYGAISASMYLNPSCLTI